MHTIPPLSRRHFLATALKHSSAIIVSASALTACSKDSNKTSAIADTQTPNNPTQSQKPQGNGGAFNHGIASGDPAHNAVILWTRITPASQGAVEVLCEVAEDEAFTRIIAAQLTSTDGMRDYTLKIDMQDLQAGSRYFYRFSTSTQQSPVGSTKTLPEGATEQAKFAVVSCSNYSAGFFHVYGEIAKNTDLDAVLHLGDYIYEYGPGVYASEDAQTLNRQVEPASELITLQDYRTRYAQYRTDTNLQAAHASTPFICVWDDHEVANDAWREGAENHSSTQGKYTDRLAAALQAYAEWMPIRPPVETDIHSLQRNFIYGDLLNLSMLDTRLAGRDKQLALSDYLATGSFDETTYTADSTDPSRTLLGVDQREWLLDQLSNGATWQILGQQVLMGVMELPTAVVTQQLSLTDFATLAQLATTAQNTPKALTTEQLQYVQDNAHLLQLGSLPYNLDAWDGYPAERQLILEAAQQINSNLIVLAGDTHNAWANNLTVNNEPAGVEFATSSISSPGLEQYLNLKTEEAVQQTEAGLTGFIDGLQYTNLADRGYILLTLTHQQAIADFQFISSIKTQDYTLLSDRAQKISVQAGEHTLTMS
ncbi:alkaline phosphatase D family protein [Marinagarivorans algicola]|uniref:alkaline phosphatase D family protein n=1 Tax=Marinagarivorans algicola TaxID=1513270 RepID=UPI003735D567